MKIFFRLTILPLLLVLFITGCKKGTNSQISKGSNQEITINITSEPQTLDPRKVRGLNDANLIRMFMEGLTRTDKNGDYTLAIAKKVDISADNMKYTFTLRDSKWSNGDPVTSQDFSYAWKKSLSPDFNSPSANMLYVIKGAKEAKLGKLPLSLVGIETPDEKTLIITLDQPVPYFLTLIDHPIYFPVNSKIDRINSHWAEKETTYIGNGPFILSDWKHQNIIVAKKNPNYWDQNTVYLSQISMIMVNEDVGFKMFDTNKLNWDGSPFSTIPVDAIETLKNTEKLQITPVLATEWIRVNTEKFPFASKKMRQAFAYAIDRAAIVNHVVQGNQIPATGIVPISMELQKNPYFNDGDIDTAQQLFQEAIDELGGNVQGLPEITLLYSSSQRNHLIAQTLQAQWREAFGVCVRLESIESKVFFDRMSKKTYVLSLGNWFADFNDPLAFLEVFKTKDVGTNNTNWENPNYHELLEASCHCSTKEERDSILRQSEEILISEMPVIPIFHFTMLYMQDDQLKDVALTPMGNIDFKWAKISSK